MTPGERITILRKTRGWSQTRLAEELGVSRSLISMVEAGARNPSVELYDGLADVFNVDVDYLMGRSNKTTVLPERLDYENRHNYTNSDTRDIANELSKNKDLSILFHAARDADPKVLKAAYEMIKALKDEEEGDTE